MRALQPCHPHRQHRHHNLHVRSTTPRSTEQHRDAIVTELHHDEHPCLDCGQIWNTLSAAEACEDQDAEDARLAKMNPPRRDPNIIRSIN